MKIKKTFPIFFVVLTLSSIFQSCSPADDFIPFRSVNSNAVIDLSGWSFSEDGPVRLIDNSWEFYWKKLCTPEDFSAEGAAVDKSTNLIDPVIITGGCAWNGTIINGKTLGADGYATYRTILRLPETEMVYSFYMTNQDSAYRIWIGGTEYSGNGKVADSASHYKPQRLPRVFHHSAKTDQVEIVLQIANYDHKWGGLTNNIYLGTPQQISDYINRITTTALFICGAIFIIAVYHLFVFLNRKKAPAPLFFSLFCFAVFFWYLFINDYLFFQFFPDFPLIPGLRLQMFSLFISPLLFILFTNAVYPSSLKDGIIKAAAVIFVVISFTALATPQRIFTSGILTIYYFLAVTACFLVLYMMSRAVIRKTEGSAFALAGFIIFFAASLYDILSNLKLITGSPYGPFMPYALFLFVLFQSFMLARQFSGAYNQLDNLLNNLERLLAQRTEQLEAAQREISEREKLAAIGTMVGGISHEIMNPLSGISGPLSVLKKEISKSEISNNAAIQKHLSFIEKNTEQIKSTVKNLNALIKNKSILTKKMNAAEIIEKVISEIKKENPEATITFTDELKKNIDSDEEILQRMLINLVSNSIDASEESADIKIKLTQKGIEIKDSGCGMTEDQIEKAFDAFYTTKTDKGGTGLGLYLVKRYAEGLGWSVEMFSSKDKGTTVFIYFKK